MPQSRRFRRPLAVVALLVSVSAMVAAPAQAQDDDDDDRPVVTVFVVVNDQPQERRGDDEMNWEMRFTVWALNDCVPRYGMAGYVSSWVGRGGGDSVRVSIEECVFNIAAVLRLESGRADCWYPAQLAWGRDPATYPFERSIRTSSNPDGESRISVRRIPGSSCEGLNEARFVIYGGESVEELPEPSAAPELLAAARRAAEIAEFDIRVQPDYPSGAVPVGCDRSFDFTVRGDGVKVPQIVQNTSAACRLRASVVGAPAPFEYSAGRSVPFDAAVPLVQVDLSELLHLEPARIAIIQDVRGSGNRGTISYAISRSCAGEVVDSPAARDASSVLYEGRFTVHSPDLPAFGPTEVYPVGATSGTRAKPAEIVGCSVTVRAGSVPGDCVVDGGNTQTLTWTEDDPITRFDFEFDVNCGAAATTTPPTTTPPTTTPPTTPATPSSTEGPRPAEPAEPAEQAAQEPSVPAGPPADQPTG